LFGSRIFARLTARSRLLRNNKAGSGTYLAREHPANLARERPSVREQPACYFWAAARVSRKEVSEPIQAALNLGREAGQQAMQAAVYSVHNSDVVLHADVTDAQCTQAHVDYGLNCLTRSMDVLRASIWPWVWVCGRLGMMSRQLVG
jgi:hypothetical protein